MDQSFAHLSDPHLTTLEQVSPRQLPNKRILGYLSWRRKRRFEHQPEVLAALTRHLQQSDCQHTVITGDLTHIGMPTEFRQGARWLESMGEPVDICLVPGNHECCVRQSWDAGFAQWEDYLAGDGCNNTEYPTLKIRGQLAFIGLSTACPTPPLMASGRLGNEQLQRLGPILEQTRRQGLFRVVYLHHSPVPGVEKWRKRLTDARQLSSLLADEGAELVLHGHGHRQRHYSLASPGGSIPIMAVPSASALGLHGADVASYRQFRVSGSEQGWKLLVSSYGYQKEEGSVSLQEQQELALPRSHAAAQDR
jgi:3',5'-cyclic AMP phosphodiesterase CpdA